MAERNPFLEPVGAVHSRTDDPTEQRYIRAYLILRVLVGAIGIGLPFALVLVEAVIFDGEPFFLDALSDYYYSGVRDLFVGALCATGIFLVTYKVAEANLDNTLSLIAGVAALFVALCPTDRPPDVNTLTKLQDWLGESAVATIHFVSASVFIAALGGISYQFGKREGKRTDQPGRLPPRFWQTFHWICAGVIALALVWCFVTWKFDVGPSEALLIGETLAVWAFGVSWLWKGLEREMLFKRPGGPPPFSDLPLD